MRHVGFPRRSDGAAEIILGGTAYRARDLRDQDQPAFGLTSKARSWSVFAEGEAPTQLSLAQIGALQGFRTDYPWHGRRTPATLQIANTVPPPMASALLATLIEGA